MNTNKSTNTNVSMMGHQRNIPGTKLDDRPHPPFSCGA
jgi:hypothetical protein